MTEKQHQIIMEVKVRYVGTGRNAVEALQNALRATESRDAGWATNEPKIVAHSVVKAHRIDDEPQTFVAKA